VRVRSCGSAIRSDAPATLAVPSSALPPAAPGAGRRERQLDGEGGPAPLGAAGDEAPAERPAQPFGDREPEPAAAVEPGHPGVALREALEQPRQDGRRDAGPGVGDLDRQAHPALGRGGRPDADRDAAALGELDRVADEVGEHLPQPAGVGAQHLRRARRHPHVERQALDAGPRLERRAEPGEERG
jgi:hypothetical protein